MAVILQIFGAAFLLLILFLAIGALVIRSKVRRFARNMEQTLGGFTKTMAAASTPSRIQLLRMAQPDWVEEEDVEDQRAPLPELGFQLVGAYQVEELDDLALEAWVNKSKSVTAVIYEHPSSGVWTDFVTRYLDGGRVTFTNGSRGGGVEHAPGHELQRFTDLVPKELFRKFLFGRPLKSMEPVDPESFAASFEKAYADEMDWRNSRGGVTEDEIRAIAQLSGETYDETTIKAARKLAEEHAMEQLQDAVLERFLKQTTMSAFEWEDVRDRTVVVHDRMSPHYFAEFLSNLLDDETHPEIDGTPETAPRRMFESLNEGFAEEGKFKMLGTVNEPVVADVYASPHRPDHDEDDDDD